jgi:hypothetical protein
MINEVFVSSNGLISIGLVTQKIREKGFFFLWEESTTPAPYPIIGIPAISLARSKKKI